MVATKITSKSMDEALEKFGITSKAKEYVDQLCQNNETFLEYPIDGAQSFSMSKRQENHAILMIIALPQLDEFRHNLCPKKMTESTFWFIYFSMLKNQTKNPLESDENVYEDWKAVLHHQRQENK